jgi:glycosyltransferase involved in cell wall biosynthesis
MRVLFVNNHLRHGGKEQFIQDSRSGLEQAGHVTALIYTVAEETAIHAGITFCIPGLDSRQDLNPTMDRLRECIGLFKPDIIHLHFGPTNLVALRWMLKRFPVMRSVHDAEFLCPTRYYVRSDTGAPCNSSCGTVCFSAGCLSIASPRSLFRLLRTKAVQRIYSRGSSLNTQSEYLRSKLLQLPANPSDVSVLPVFVPTPAPYVPPDDNFRFLYAGRLHRLKGPQIAIEAMTQLPAAAILDIAGSGVMEGELRKQVQTLGLESRVHFLGYLSREELQRQYTRAAAVVCPAIHPENCPVVIQESLAAGRPVIATPVGGIPELLDDGVEGLLVPMADVNAIATAMRSIMDDPEMAQQMGRNGRRRISREEYSRDYHVRELLTEYQSSIRKFSRGGR